ncbi:sensor histidine kinase [Cohnella sp. GCM10012308]|uniref:cache domain-containing sensor histidine kinase n=1 Tax=Cohnella sp. GCM10012308 TaxID=3317329 RepID=UPI003623CC37
MTMLGAPVRKLWSYVQDLKIQHKLILIFFFLMIVPLGAFTLLAYRQTAQTIQKNTVYSASQSFEQAASSLESRIRSASLISDYIILDEEAIRIFGRMDSAAYAIPSQVKDGTYLLRMFRYLLRNQDIFLIRLFVPDELVFAGDGQSIYGLSGVREAPWYGRLLGSNGKLLLTPTTTQYTETTGAISQHPVLSTLRLVKNPNDYARNMGVLSVDILQSDVQAMLEQAARLTDSGVVYLADADGGIVQSSADAAQTARWRIADDPAAPWKRVKVNGKDAIVGYRAVAGSDWRMVSVIPLEDILAASAHQRNVLILVMLAMTVAAYGLAYISSFSSTRRIYRLIFKMRQVQSGHLSVIHQNFGRDEIGELADSYNFMIKKIEVLIDEQFKTGQAMKNAELKLVQAELKALQSQINPHFLYNTLDLINWMAIKHDNPDIESLIGSLSSFYKLSLRKGRDIVSIEDELHHLRTYVDIQNHRFEDSIRLVLDVDPDILDCEIPKITLQPLAENSIMHGIQMKPDKRGTVTVSGRLEDGAILLRVRDDGVGMSESALSGMLERPSRDEYHGFGVYNIHERLKLSFGAPYGLRFESKLGEGTAVEIRIPPAKGLGNAS